MEQNNFSCKLYLNIEFTWPKGVSGVATWKGLCSSGILAVLLRFREDTVRFGTATAGVTCSGTVIHGEGVANGFVVLVVDIEGVPAIGVPVLALMSDFCDQDVSETVHESINTCLIDYKVCFTKTC